MIAGSDSGRPWQGGRSCRTGPRPRPSPGSRGRCRSRRLPGSPDPPACRMSRLRGVARRIAVHQVLGPQRFAHAGKRENAERDRELVPPVLAIQPVPDPREQPRKQRSRRSTAPSPGSDRNPRNDKSLRRLVQCGGWNTGGEHGGWGSFPGWGGVGGGGPDRGPGAACHRCGRWTDLRRAGSAMPRSAYWRARWDDPGPPLRRSWCRPTLPDEIGKGDLTSPAPFVAVQLSRRIGVRAPHPRLSQEEGFVVLEDLGDEMVSRLDAATPGPALFTAVDQLARMRMAADTGAGPGLHRLSSAATTTTSTAGSWITSASGCWEPGKDGGLSASEERLVDRHFDEIAERLAAEPAGFTTGTTSPATSWSWGVRTGGDRLPGRPARPAPVRPRGAAPRQLRDARPGLHRAHGASLPGGHLGRGGRSSTADFREVFDRAHRPAKAQGRRPLRTSTA